jgi:hypothetical protein
MKGGQNSQAIPVQGASVSPGVVDTRIHQMEAEHDLLRYTIDGWCAWPLIRFGVARVLQNLPLVEIERFPRSEWLATGVKDISKLVAVRKARYVVKTYSSARSEQEGGLYKDVYFDQLLLDVGDYFKIESINNKVFIPKARTALVKTDITTTAFRIIAGLLARIGGPRYISGLASNLSAYLQAELGLQAFTPRMIALLLRNFYWSKKLYSWFLRRIAPEYLLVADPGEYNIIAAAKEQGIKVIEFQHGFIDRHHSAYSWSAYALDYKELMPIPDRIFLYGEYWKQELSANGFWDDTLCVVGSLRMDQYRKLKAATHKGEVCALVLTTQGLDVEKTIAFMADFLEAATGHLNVRLYIKLHPVYEMSKAPYLTAFREDQRVQVLRGDEAPSTFELLTQADVHLSISSTCHYEALGLGVPTVILPFATHDVVLPLYAAGHASLAHTSQDLLNIILQWQDRKIPADISEWYFKVGALESIKRELRILSELG